jgi:hypothetical protein
MILVLECYFKLIFDTNSVTIFIYFRVQLETK